MKKVVKTWVGVDVSAKTFDICYVENGKMKSQKMYQDNQGFKHFLSILEKLQNVHVVMEATGIYHFGLYNFLAENEIDRSVVSGFVTSNFAKVQRQLGKVRNDKTDAELIRLYGETMKPAVSFPYSHKIQVIRSLRRLKIHLKNEILSVEKLAKVQNVEGLVMGSDAMVDALKQLKLSLQMVEKQIDDKINADRDLKRQKEIFLSIPGIGPESCVELIVAEMSRFKTVNQMCSYFGVTPGGKDSGTSVVSANRISTFTDRYARGVFYMASNMARRKIPKLAMLYERLEGTAKKSTKNLARIACVHKMLKIAYYCWKNNETYNAEK